MPNYMNQEGDFRVLIDEYGVKERESGAICISTRAKVLDRWIPADGDQDGYWESWAEHDVVVYGDFYIILSNAKGNKLNDKQIESLVAYCGWNGALPSIHDGSWKPTPCRASVKGDEYNGETRYKMSWLSDYNSTPGGMSNLDDTAIKRIEARHASAMRAIAGNVKRNTPPVDGPPAAPSAPPQASTADVNAELAAEAESNSKTVAPDIPF